MEDWVIAAVNMGGDEVRDGIERWANPFADWQYLACHPRLRWLPPLWRGRDDMDARHFENFIVRSVERNLVVTVDCDSGTSRFVLRTGPLQDLRRGDDVDPITPAMEIDDRLCGVGASFEEALSALACQVKQVYDNAVRSVPPAPPRATATERVNYEGSLTDQESSTRGSPPPSASGSVTP